MPRMSWLAPFVVIFLSSCVGQTSAHQRPVGPTQSSTKCSPQVPGALTARPPAVKTRLRGHTVVASSTLRFLEGKHVTGRCVDEIVATVWATPSSHQTTFSSSGKMGQ
jgi:hypothetical protein